MFAIFLCSVNASEILLPVIDKHVLHSVLLILHDTVLNDEVHNVEGVAILQHNGKVKTCLTVLLISNRKNITLLRSQSKFFK